MNAIVKVLMERDGLSKEDAEGVFDMAKLDLKKRLKTGEIPYDICWEYFGLGPDFIVYLV